MSLSLLFRSLPVSSLTKILAYTDDKDHIWMICKTWMKLFIEAQPKSEKVLPANDSNYELAKASMT